MWEILGNGAQAGAELVWERGCHLVDAGAACGAGASDSHPAVRASAEECSTETLTIWSPLNPQARHSESAGLGVAPDSPACTVPRPATASSRMTATSNPLRATVPMLEVLLPLALRNRQGIYDV
jgi:hypothetical protein